MAISPHPQSQLEVWKMRWQRRRSTAPCSAPPRRRQQKMLGRCFFWLDLFVAFFCSNRFLEGSFIIRVSFSRVLEVFLDFMRFLGVVYTGTGSIMCF